MHLSSLWTLRAIARRTATLGDQRLFSLSWTCIVELLSQLQDERKTSRWTVETSAGETEADDSQRKAAIATAQADRTGGDDDQWADSSSRMMHCSIERASEGMNEGPT